MASKIPSTISSSEINESADYSLDGKASRAYDDGVTLDSENSLAKESWNNPSVNKYRLCSCFILFISGSLFFSSFGVSSSLSIVSPLRIKLIPHLRSLSQR